MATPAASARRRGQFPLGHVGERGREGGWEEEGREEEGGRGAGAEGAPLTPRGSINPTSCLSPPTRAARRRTRSLGPPWPWPPRRRRGATQYQASPRRRRG